MRFILSQTLGRTGIERASVSLSLRRRYTLGGIYPGMPPKPLRTVVYTRVCASQTSQNSGIYTMVCLPNLSEQWYIPWCMPPKPLRTVV